MHSALTVNEMSVVLAYLNACSSPHTIEVLPTYNPLLSTLLLFLGPDPSPRGSWPEF